MQGTSHAGTRQPLISPIQNTKKPRAGRSQARGKLGNKQCRRNLRSSRLRRLRVPASRRKHQELGWSNLKRIEKITSTTRKHVRTTTSLTHGAASL